MNYFLTESSLRLKLEKAEKEVSDLKTQIKNLEQRKKEEEERQKKMRENPNEAWMYQTPEERFKSMSISREESEKRANKMLNNHVKESIFVKKYKSDLNALVRAYFHDSIVLDIPDEPNKKIVLSSRYPNINEFRLFNIYMQQIYVCAPLIDVDKRELDIKENNNDLDKIVSRYRYMNMKFNIPTSCDKYINTIINYLGGSNIYINYPQVLEAKRMFDEVYNLGPVEYNRYFTYKNIQFTINLNTDTILYLTYYLISLK